MIPLRYLAHVTAGQSPPSEFVSDLGAGLPFLQGNAEFGATSPTPRLQCDSAPKWCEAGDTLISVRAPVGAMNVADRRYGIGRGLAAIRPIAGQDPRYIRYAILAEIPRLLSLATGTTFSAVSADDLRGIRLPSTALPEQSRIAKFLDEQVGLLDGALVVRLRQSALLLERYRSQLARLILLPVSEGVSVRMIDLFEYERNGIWGDEADGGLDDVHCARVADFDRESFRVTKAPTIRRVPLSQRRSRLLRDGDVLLEKSGGSIDKPVGCAVIYRGPTPAVCSNFVAALRPVASVDATYAGLVLAASYQIRRNAPYVTQTTGIQNLDSAAYLRQRIGLPSSQQQRLRVEVVEDLRRATEQLRALNARHSHLLAERKQSLIAAAVTGQFDVTTARKVSTT